MKIAIMQPYIFPYIGYFQLINKVDKFIFYDDVNFIKKGWINRNNLLINGNPKLFTIPLVKASQNKLICEIEVNDIENWKNNFLKTIEFNYKNTIYFKEIFDLIKDILEKDFNTIADLAIKSIVKISEFLELNSEFEISSELYSKTRDLIKEKRLIKITGINKATEYINPLGGINLYSKEIFLNNKIILQFLKPEIKEYAQKKSNFVPSLSIIDLLMNLSKKDVKKHIALGTLI